MSTCRSGSGSSPRARPWAGARRGFGRPYSARPALGREPPQRQGSPGCRSRSPPRAFSAAASRSRSGSTRSVGRMADHPLERCPRLVLRFARAKSSCETELRTARLRLGDVGARHLADGEPVLGRLELAGEHVDVVLAQPHDRLVAHHVHERRSPHRGAPPARRCAGPRARRARRASASFTAL